MNRKTDGAPCDAWRRGRTGEEGRPGSDRPPRVQPLPSVDPAFDLAFLPDEEDASVFPALLSAAFEGFPDDLDDDFAIRHSFRFLN